MSDLMALIRNAATQYGRCCDLYQDSLGGFHCHEDGQRTFQMLRDVQGLLGVDKGNGQTTDEERAASIKRARLNHAAPDLLEALKVLLSEAENFSVSDVSFTEKCMGHKGPALAHAAIAKATTP